MDRKIFALSEKHVATEQSTCRLLKVKCLDNLHTDNNREFTPKVSNLRRNSSKIFLKRCLKKIPEQYEVITQQSKVTSSARSVRFDEVTQVHTFIPTPGEKFFRKYGFRMWDCCSFFECLL